MATMLTMAVATQAKALASAKNILALETQLAKQVANSKTLEILTLIITSMQQKILKKILPALTGIIT
jgi:hypothetical protein